MKPQMFVVTAAYIFAIFAPFTSASADQVSVFVASGQFEGVGSYGPSTLSGLLTIDTTTGNIVSEGLRSSSIPGVFSAPYNVPNSSVPNSNVLFDALGGFNPNGAAFHAIVAAPSLVGYSGGSLGSLQQPVAGTGSYTSVSVGGKSVVNGDLEQGSLSANIPVVIGGPIEDPTPVSANLQQTCNTGQCAVQTPVTGTDTFYGFHWTGSPYGDFSAYAALTGVSGLPSNASYEYELIDYNNTVIGSAVLNAADDYQASLTFPKSPTFSFDPTETPLQSGDYKIGIISNTPVDPTLTLDFGLTSTISAAPEPSTWALMIAGLACTGLTFRRAKRTICLGSSGIFIG